MLIPKSHIDQLADIVAAAFNVDNPHVGDFVIDVRDGEPSVIIHRVGGTLLIAITDEDNNFHQVQRQ